MAPEDESGEHLPTRPDGKVEAGGVQTFSDVVLPFRPRRGNGSETPQETLPSKGLDRDDHVLTGGHLHTESEEASWPEKGSGSPDQTSPRSVPPSTTETESVSSGSPSIDPTSFPIFKRIGGPQGPRRSPRRATRSTVAQSECTLHAPAGCQSSGAQGESPLVIFRTRGFEAEGREDTSEKIPGGLSLPVPKPRVKKRLSGSFPDAFSPPESGSDGSEQNELLGLPVPLPRTKKRLSGAFSGNGPPPEGTFQPEDTAASVEEPTESLAHPLQGELGVPSELEKQVLAAMEEEYPEKVAFEVSESWTDEKDLMFGTWTGAAQDDWLHVGGSEDRESKEEELDFGFVSVGGPAGSGRVQR